MDPRDSLCVIAHNRPTPATLDCNEMGVRTAASTAIVCIALSACGSTHPTAQAGTPSPSAYASSASTPPPISSPSASLSPSASPNASEGLACRLPVVVGSTPGFVTFPGGVFAADPQPRTISVPGYPYPSSLIYDQPVGRWLSGLPWSWVSSDGSRYVYRGADGSIHLATVAEATDTVIVASKTSPSGGGWFPIAMSGQQIFLAVGSNEVAAPAPYYGVWSANQDGSGLKMVTQSGVFNAIDQGGAWGVTPQSAANLNRLDLTTGIQVAWFSPSDGFISLYGFDTAGHPIIGINPSSNSGGNYRVGILTAKDTFQAIGLPAGTAWGTSQHYVQNGLGAPEGIWLAVQDGSLLFAAQGLEFKVVATVPGVSSVAAPCQ